MKKILRWPVVYRKTSISRSTVWRLERAGLFPQRVRIGMRGVGWYESEIDKFLADRERVNLGGKER
ncbi:MAG TPA: AlpA family phage regulatory protein [Desulfobulbaceae bacterium]|nr:AlpA family phage regulatory protein [Desulfobulbaceae bacterium]